MNTEIERQAFEALQKKLGIAEEYLERDEAFPDKYSWVSIQDRWATWQAAWNTRPAQTEQQPVGQWSDDEGLSWCDASPHELASARESGWLTRTLYATPSPAMDAKED